jgi:hypothetical protein
LAFGRFNIAIAVMSLMRNRWEVLEQCELVRTAGLPTAAATIRTRPHLLRQASRDHAAAGNEHATGSRHADHPGGAGLPVSSEPDQADSNLQRAPGALVRRVSAVRSVQSRASARAT